MMNVQEFDFELPEELNAATPLVDLTASSLLVLNKETGEIQHENFPHIMEELHAGDVLVLNNTKVLPARLIGTKEDTGATSEVLLLKEHAENEWETLVKPANRVKLGTVVSAGDGNLKARCTEHLPECGRKFT